MAANTRKTPHVEKSSAARKTVPEKSPLRQSLPLGLRPQRINRSSPSSRGRNSKQRFRLACSSRPTTAGRRPTSIALIFTIWIANCSASNSTRIPSGVPRQNSIRTDNGAILIGDRVKTLNSSQTPIPTETGPMPSNHRLGRDDDQRLIPGGPEPGAMIQKFI